MHSSSARTEAQPGRFGSLWMHAILGPGVCLVLFLWLRESHVLLPQAGTQSVLAAHALLDGRGLELDPGVPFSKYPPIYPLLLAPLGAAGMQVTAAIFALNAATLALTLCGLFALARVMGMRGAPWAPGIYLALGSTHYLLRTARGDAIAIAATIAMALGLAVYARGGARRALVAAAAAAAVAGLARHMALFTTIPVGLLVVLWLGRSASRGGRARWRDAWLFGGLSCLPLGLWLARNQWVKGHAFGIPKVTEARAGAQGTTFLDNLHGLVGTPLRDLFDPQVLGVIRVVHGAEAGSLPSAAILAASIATLSVLVLGWFAVRGGRGGHAGQGTTRSAEELSTTERDARGRLWARRVLASFVLVYALALIAIWTVGQNDPIHTRYVAPLYAPCILLAMDLGEGARRRGAGPIGRAALALLALAVVVPNVPKSLELLGESPSAHVIEITSRQGRNRWHKDLTWDLRSEPGDQDH